MRIDAEWDAIGHKLAGTDPAFANVRVACIVAAMPLAGLPPPPPRPRAVARAASPPSRRLPLRGLPSCQQNSYPQVSEPCPNQKLTLAPKSAQLGLFCSPYNPT